MFKAIFDEHEEETLMDYGDVGERIKRRNDIMRGIAIAIILLFMLVPLILGFMP